MNQNLDKILPSDALEQILSIGSEKSYGVNEFFLKAGDVPNKIALVKSGLFRYVYTNEKGYEFTKGIIQENNFISSYSAMINRQPSYFTIEALEKSELVEIQWEDFKSLLKDSLFWHQFLLKMIEKGFIVKEKRERDLLLLDAETRYRNFLSEYPGVDQRVTQNIIASYLGIKPETLSRIRKKNTF